jgi:hypothetical protein
MRDPVRLRRAGGRTSGGTDDPSDEVVARRLGQEHAREGAGAGVREQARVGRGLVGDEPVVDDDETVHVGACVAILPTRRSSVSSCAPLDQDLDLGPTRRSFRAKAIRCCSLHERVRRLSFTAAGRRRRGEGAGDSSWEYVKTAEMVEAGFLDERRGASNSASVSPGKPTMNVLRIAAPGIARRNRSSRARWRFSRAATAHPPERVGVRVLERHVDVRTTRGSSAIAAISASVTVFG